jgi:hypothetical protein
VHFQFARETSQSFEAADGKFLCGLFLAEMEEGEPEGRSKNRREGAVFGRLYPHGVNAARLGVAPHLVKKYGFAYASQADEHHAFGWTSQAEALQADFDVLANLMSASEFWWWTAGSRGVGIANGVHNYREFSRFMLI